MQYEMKLNSSPFVRIKSGEKTVEMRLFDEKRRSLKIGEIIRFTNVETGERIFARILALHTYPSFFGLYERFDKKAIGYKEGETARAEDMYAYYSEEEIEKYGVVGIEIAVME